MKFHPKTFVFLQIKNVSKKMQPGLARYSWMRKKARGVCEQSAP